MIHDLVRANRSYRRFHEERPIDEQTLRKLVELGRLSPSAANLQPLKYMILASPEKNVVVFPTLAWAGYLKDWQGPEEGERPTGYIIVLGDTEISKGFGCDHGIACQSILLGAAEKGLGGCMIGSVDREQLRCALSIPDTLEILLVLALGYPKETVVIEDVSGDADIRYYRDEADTHHVPKRSLSDIIIG